MEPHTISDYNDLVAHITALKNQKSVQKETLIAGITKLSKIFNIGNILQQTTDLAPVKKVNDSLKKAGLNLGTELLIDQIWGRHHSIGGFISAFAVRKICHTLINKSVNKDLIKWLKSKV